MPAFQSLLRSGVLICALGLNASTTFADDIISNHPLLSDRYTFTLGVFYFRNTTEASVSPSGGGTGRNINFENSLDLNKQVTTPMLGFIWRASERWRMEAEYFELKRNATHSLDADTQWGDQTFPAGTAVDSSFNVTDGRISAGYSFYRTRDTELGAGLGLHIFGLETSLSTSSQSARGRKVTTPLPVINLYGNLALSEAWAIGMRADWLSLTNGEIRDLSIDMHYQPWRNVGLGFGMRSLVINLTIDSSDWQGEARINFQGPTAFVSASF